MVAVVDGEGHFAGYAIAGDGDPRSQASGLEHLGSRHRLDGAPVIDRKGALTGYLIAGLGFVTKQQASSPSTIDRLYDDSLAARAAVAAHVEDSTGTSTTLAN